MVLARVPVTIVWRRRMVPPAPRGGLMSEKFSERNGRGREERDSLLLANSLHILKVRKRNEDAPQ